MGESLTLLLVRPTDLFVAAVRVSAHEVVGEALRLPAGARVELLLPPQSTGETVYRPGTSDIVAARLSGPSRLTFVLAEATDIPLTVTGFLTALRSAALDTAAGDWPNRTLSLELPWRLWLAPRPHAERETLRAVLPVAELVGPSGAAGLWHVRLQADSGLDLVPFHVGDDRDIEPPLNRGRRDRIYGESGTAKPTAPFVDLSPLGGTMSASGTWPTFSWRQDTVLGRDMTVRTEAKGVLFPYGHPAVLVEVATRELTTVDGMATAGLVEQRTLIVTEPVRRRAAHGPLARGFPFPEVEITQRVFPLTDEEVPEKFTRQAKRLDALVAALEANRQSVAAKAAALGALYEQRRADIVVSADQQKGEILRVVDDLGNRIRFLEEIDAVYQEYLRTLPPEPPVRLPEYEPPEGEPYNPVPYEPPPPPPPQLTHEQWRELEQLRAQVAEQLARIGEIDTWAQQALSAVGTEDDLIAAGGDFRTAVAELRELRDRLVDEEARVAAIRDEVEQKHDVYLWPVGLDGERLRIPVRCGEVQLSTPVIFVHDIDLPEDDDFHRFSTLTDSTIIELPTTLADAWRQEDGHRAEVPSVAIDLVGSAEPRELDVLTVQQLVFSGVPTAHGFHPVLDEATVALPAVAELVPGQGGVTRVGYTDDYRNTGDATHVALRLLDKVAVDFVGVADKAGALVVPKCDADVLARRYGPVAARALPDYKPIDLSQAFAGATVLGVPLASVVDGARLRTPLEITQVPGGVLMRWADLPLRSSGPLEVTADTRCQLTVVRTATETRTECRMERFALILPPGTGDLIRLNFAALTFSQVPGRPPDLRIEGLSIELGGDLGLLKNLEDVISLTGQVPTVRSTASGLSVSYRFAVPSAEAGVFVMRNIAVGVEVEIPFNGDSPVVRIGFASRRDPFILTVYAFGGGGYLVFEIADQGIRSVEASLDFGAMVAIGVGIASAEVHALGGVRFLLAGGGVVVTGFVRIGGSVDVLGLVSVSVELRVELSYDRRELLTDGERNPHYGALVGRASLVIEIDVTFWSGDIVLDSGEYVLAGGMADDDDPPAGAHTAVPAQPDWQSYREAYRR